MTMDFSITRVKGQRLQLIWHGYVPLYDILRRSLIFYFHLVNQCYSCIGEQSCSQHPETCLCCGLNPHINTQNKIREVEKD